MDGQALEFEVSHQHAHAPGTLHDPPVAFDLKLLGDEKAELVNKAQGDGPAMVVTRKVY
jgi:hypothetical protein